MRGTCKLHTEKPPLDSNQAPSSCEAATTLPQRCYRQGPAWGKFLCWYEQQMSEHTVLIVCFVEILLNLNSSYMEINNCSLTK